MQLSSTRSIAPQGLAGSMEATRGRTRLARRAPLTTIAVLGFSVLCVLFVLLRPLIPVDETRYLTVAWEMWQGGSKVVPHVNGELYGHKPPLLFWLIDLVWLGTGVSEFVARLVSPVFAVASVALTAALGRALWPADRQRPGRAALILATTGVFLIYGSATMFDAMLTAAVLLGMLALWRRVQDGGRRWVLLLGLALAFGVYAKGPVILVHLGPAALLAPIWRDPARPLPWRRHGADLGLALLVALGLVALWLIPALILGGTEYQEEVLWRQSAGRMVQAFDHDRPVWWFLLLLPVYLWPWGWSPAALRSLAPRLLLADPASRFVAVWALSAILSFSLISGKQAHYLLPELPALALLLSRSWGEGAQPWRILPVLPALVLPVLGLAMLLGLVPDVEEMGIAYPTTIVLATALIVATLAYGVWKVRSRLLAWGMVAPLTVLALHALLAPILLVSHDPDPIARLLAPHEAAGIAWRDKDYEGQLNFAGRLTRPVALLTDAEEVAAWAAEHPGGVIAAPAHRDRIDLPVLDQVIFRTRLYTIHQVPEEDAP